MKTNTWNDWLAAQKHWAMLVSAGYRAHTPESIFYLSHFQIDRGIEWTNPKERREETEWAR